MLMVSRRYQRPPGIPIAWNVIRQRLVPGSHFEERTAEYLKTWGLFEITIKTLTLCFFLGSLFYIWKSDRELKNLQVKVNEGQESNWNKYENLLRIFKFLTSFF
jgi:hypothetical protein